MEKNEIRGERIKVCVLADSIKHAADGRESTGQGHTGREEQKGEDYMGKLSYFQPQVHTD